MNRSCKSCFMQPEFTHRDGVSVCRCPTKSCPHHWPWIEADEWDEFMYVDAIRDMKKLGDSCSVKDVEIFWNGEKIEGFSKGITAIVVPKGSFHTERGRYLIKNLSTGKIDGDSQYPVSKTQALDTELVEGFKWVEIQTTYTELGDLNETP